MHNQQKNNSCFLALKAVIITCLVRKLSYRLLDFSAEYHYIQVTKEKEQMANIEDFYKTWALTKEKTDN